MLAALAVTIASGVSAPFAQAGTITWTAPQLITGDTDVSTAGTLVGAFNFGEPTVSSATMNGVTFQPFGVSNLGVTSVTVGNFTIAAPNGLSSRNFSAGSASPPFSLLSPDYQTFLASFVSSFGPMTLTIAGLTLGTTYDFQWWTNWSAMGAEYRTEATNGNTVTLDTNPTNTDGGLGEFAIGTFTASSTTEVITFQNLDVISLISGFQLRQIGSAAVPDSGSTFGLLSVALFALFGVTRFRARQLA